MRSASLLRAALLALLVPVVLSAPVARAVDPLRAQLHGPYEVATRTVTLIDDSRPTDAHGAVPELPQRVLKTTVWYPAARRPLERLRPSAPPRIEGPPMPLVIYSHGFSSFRTEGRYLARHLASRGYVVMAADFPLTGYFTKGGPRVTDVANQPGDVSFLIDSALAWNDEAGHLLEGALDPQRIAAVGLSLGGLTTTLVALHPRLGDQRIRAAVSLAGPAFMFTPAYYAHADVPYMMVAGTLDALVDYTSNAAPLTANYPGATLVTLVGASHLGFTPDGRLLFPWRHHPDALACRVVGKRLPEGDGRENLVTVLGTEAEGIAPASQARFCTMDPLPRAMRPGRELELTEAAVVSFLAIHLGEDPDAAARYRQWLYEDWPASAADVEVLPHLPAPPQ